MKIEICEQMVQSWLINCKDCQIAQTNWMISPVALERLLRDKVKMDEARRFMEEVQTVLRNGAAGNYTGFKEEFLCGLQEVLAEDAYACYLAEGGEASRREFELDKVAAKEIQNVFKQSKTETLIRQCEIDVVGVKLEDGKAEELYLVDSAYHSGGLGYDQPVARVVKKIIRAIIVSDLVFGVHAPVQVIFAAPECKPAPRQRIRTVLDLLEASGVIDNRPALHGAPNNVTVKFWVCDEFATEIYAPLAVHKKILNHDNDLFMRAINLEAAAESHLPARAPASAPARSKAGSNKARILAVLDDLTHRGKLAGVLTQLQQKSFFGGSYPLLQKETGVGYQRRHYYAGDTLTVGGDTYLICSQFSLNAIENLEDWAKTV